MTEQTPEVRSKAEIGKFMSLVTFVGHVVMQRKSSFQSVIGEYIHNCAFRLGQVSKLTLIEWHG